MKKILLTNFSFKNYSGSEIDTMTIADFFIKEGYRVDIFTLEKGEPLINHCNKKIRIITLNEKKLLYKEYNVIWSHHYPLLDYILFEEQIKSDFIFYMSLSAFEPYEVPPEYCNELSLIGAISEEVKNKLIEEGCDKEKIHLFPNYAPSKYFNNKINKVKEIKKICVVSNHVPDELIQLKNMAQKESIEVDIYGKEYVYKYVDDNLLNEYDVIISIGKTVYYSLAIGKLVYCYDYFGGYGYINKNNIEKAYEYNFSGRGFGKKMTGEEILNDIKVNYNKVQKDLNILKKFVKKEFDLELNIRNVLSKMKKNKIDVEKIIKKYPALKRRANVHVVKINIVNEENKKLREENKILKEYFENKDIVKEIITLKEHEKKYNEIIKSTSWKITKPMRMLKNFFIKRNINKEKGK